MRHLVSVLPSVLLAIGFAAPVAADVITDWTEKALPIVATYSLGAPAYRDMAMMHVAMFQCVNAIEPLYQPYKGKLEAPPTTSKEAAAAVAAATVLSRLHPPDAGKIEAMRDRPAVALHRAQHVHADRRPALQGQAVERGRERAAVRVALDGDARRDRRRARGEIPLRVLAARHRDPQRRHRRQ